MPVSVKRLLKILSVAVFVLLLGCLLTVSPIDRTPLEEQSFYRASIASADTHPIEYKKAQTKLRAGWSKISITPDYSLPMAGYRPRDHFESVHDSLYVRVLVLDNGNAKVAIISVDLLLFPPILKDRITKALQHEIDYIYIGATHTHNGPGAWDDSFAGQLSIGDYDNTWVNQLSDKIIVATRFALADIMPARIAYGEATGNDLVGNRLKWGGPTEGTIRSLRIHRSDSSKAIFFTFGAHANSIYKKSHVLSADYPGQTIANLEGQGVDFAMYIAGMVGSHRVKYLDDKLRDFELIDSYANELSKRLINTTYNLSSDSLSIKYAHIPLTLGEPQMRILSNWRIRPWLFDAALGPLEGEMSLLKLGDITLIGTPCDFSGELYLNYLSDVTSPLIVTSFNGNYIGYITEDSAYDEINKAEVRNMNWVGPYHGLFMGSLVKRIVERVE